MGEEKMPPHPLSPTCRQESWSRVMTVEELILLLNSCSTQKNGPCTLPGQHNRADSVGRDADKPTPHTCMGDLALSLNCHTMEWARKGCLASSSAPLHLWQVEELALRSRKWEDWFCPPLTAALRIAGPTPHLGSMVELTLLVEDTGELTLKV